MLQLRSDGDPESYAYISIPCCSVLDIRQV